MQTRELCRELVQRKCPVFLQVERSKTLSNPRGLRILVGHFKLPPSASLVFSDIAYPKQYSQACYMVNASIISYTWSARMSCSAGLAKSRICLWNISPYMNDNNQGNGETSILVRHLHLFRLYSAKSGRSSD